MKTTHLITLIAISILLLSCTVNIPAEQVEVSDTMTLLISESLPESSQLAELQISMAGGKLDITGGADNWVEGKIDYNVPLWQPEVIRTDNRLEITQTWKENLNFSDKIVNKWSLKLGQAPMDITINAGAYDSRLDLSGVPVTGLDISDGASNTVVTFSEPNPTVMEKLQYKSGASNIEFDGLGNANFKEMRFEGGAGSYKFDFSGQLQQDAQVDIRGGAGSFEIIIPANTPVTVILSKTLGEVALEGTWNINGQEYTASGTGPGLEIEINLSLGKVTLIKE